MFSDCSAPFAVQIYTDTTNDSQAPTATTMARGILKTEKTNM